MIVAMAGLPGTGKSTISQALAARSAGIVLNKDVLRSTLFPPEYVEYSSEQDDFCQSLMLQTAAYLLARNASLRIFLDGRTFSRRYQIERVREAARQLRTSCRVIECVCSESAARERLEQDTTHPARNRNFALYQKLQREFEPIADPKLVIDTEAPLEECVHAAGAYLSNS